MQPVMSNRCPHCSAPVEDRSHRFCSYCGNELPRPAAPASPRQETSARFAALRETPGFEEALHEAPRRALRRPSNGQNAGLIIGVVAIFLFGLFALASSSGSRQGSRAVHHLGGPPGSFEVFDPSPGVGIRPILGIGFVGIAILAALRAVGALGQGASDRSAGGLGAGGDAPHPTTTRVPALVRDERTEVDGGAHNSAVRTRYFVTLEAEDGARAEYRMDEHLAGHVAPGDLGVATITRGWMQDFRVLGA